MDADRTLGATIDGATSVRPEPHESRLLGPGDAVDRYLLLGKLGAGGMGVVYSAYDPELDRKVALKLLLPESDRGAGSLGRARLLREAQALARLSHPNVVAVHDVGTHGDQVWVAMEFVEGRTLGAWAREQPRTWLQRLRVLTDVARGVAAAHAAGLVHRDLKPDNVMIGDDGRVRVMDFGLAHGRTPTNTELELASAVPGVAPRRTHDAPPARPPRQLADLPSDSFAGTLLAGATPSGRRITPSLVGASVDVTPAPTDAPADSFAGTISADPTSRPHDVTSGERRLDHAALSLRLTQLGAIQGTPAYMAPEQWRGEEAEAAADQFGWSVMAWEILYGELPFAGDTIPTLVRAIMSGHHRPPRKDRRVPAWLRRTLERGLASDPARRWPSMAALLAALVRGRARARLRAPALVLLGLAGLVAAALLARQMDIHRRVDRCAAAGAQIDEVWHDDARRQIREAFAATGLAFAATAADHVMPWLDDRAAAWRRTRTTVCLDTEVRARWHADLEARALWCLEDRQLELASLIAEFRRASPTTLQKAVPAAAALRPADDCRAADLLQRRPAPPDDRDALLAAREQLSHAHTLTLAGNFKPALAIVLAARDAPAVARWSPLRVAAQAQEGRLLARTGAYAEAEAASADAYFGAAEADAWDLAVAAATDQILTVGVRRARPAEARVWARHAAVAIVHAGDPEGLLAADRLFNLAEVHAFAGEYPEARALHEQALALRQAALGADHPDVAASLRELAGVRLDLGDHAEARALHERAVAIDERVLGPDHPDYGLGLQALALVHQAVAETDEAIRLHTRALEIRERALGPDHAELASTLNNLANAYLTTGDYARAQALQERALRIYEQAFGPDHPNVAISLTNLAVLHSTRGEPALARPLAERALAIFAAALGPDHPNVAISMSGLADTHRTLGDHAAAIALYERALPILEQSLGPDHLNIAILLQNLAIARAATGELDRAIALHQRSLAIEERALGPDHPDIARTLVSLARLHEQAGRSTEARALRDRAAAIQARAAAAEPPPATAAP